jgi:preprotein translocase subunit SecA
LTVFGMDPDFNEATFNTSKIDTLIDQFQMQAQTFYAAKKEKVAEILYPFVKDVQEKEGHRYSRILIPFTDGSTHPLPVSADLKKAYNSEGKTIMNDLEQTITLSIIDEEWKEHLRNMDDLKDATQGASFEQKDPLVVYKIEAFNLFKEFVNRVNEKVISYLYKGMVMIQQDEQVRQAPAPQKMNQQKLKDNRFEEQERMQRQAAQNAGQSDEQRRNSAPVIRDANKVGRNDACPCGSGKKFKNCHGQGVGA